VTFIENEIRRQLFEAKKSKKNQGFNDQFRALNYEPPYPQWLYSTIRAIYDGKYMEHVMLEDFGKMSNFTEYVYSWLGTFTVCPLKKHVRLMEFYEQEDSDHLRLQLLLGLKLNSEENKMWEYHTFLEFLNEKMALDDLVYFLHCRNLLYKGPQTNHPNAFNSRVHYVSVRQANGLVDVMF